MKYTSDYHDWEFQAGVTGVELAQAKHTIAEQQARIKELENAAAANHWRAIEEEKLRKRIMELEKCGEHRQVILEIQEERIEELEAENQRLQTENEILLREKVRWILGGGNE